MYIMFIFFFNDTATTEIYTLSLHDALPIYLNNIPIFSIRSLSHTSYNVYFAATRHDFHLILQQLTIKLATQGKSDRKSTRLNSSHANISYAVFCLKKKKICNITDN